MKLAPNSVDAIVVAVHLDYYLTHNNYPEQLVQIAQHVKKYPRIALVQTTCTLLPRTPEIVASSHLIPLRLAQEILEDGVLADFEKAEQQSAEILGERYLRIPDQINPEYGWGIAEILDQLNVTPRFGPEGKSLFSHALTGGDMSDICPRYQKNDLKKGKIAVNSEGGFGINASVVYSWILRNDLHLPKKQTT